MKYCFTTLAIGDPYFEKSLKFHMDLHEKTQFCVFNITTTESDLENIEKYTGFDSCSSLKEKYPKINITTIESFNHKVTHLLHAEGNGFTFNLNLKVLAIKACLKLFQDMDYLFLVDGDWSIYDAFQEEKILKLIELMEINEIDFAFERPARIGDARECFEKCFYDNKVIDYNLKQIPIWDDAHVVNEQFMGFKNNWKLTCFAQKWEQLLWYSMANGIRNYPDGFEIGISALESKMKWSWCLFSVLNGCFSFYTKYTNVQHVRY